MIAATVKNLHAIDFGFMVVMPTIIIPNLTGFANEHNRNETLSVSDAEASWIGKQNFFISKLFPTNKNNFDC